MRLINMAGLKKRKIMRMKILRKEFVHLIRLSLTLGSNRLK